MTISDVIEMLEELREICGDIPVHFSREKGRPVPNDPKIAAKIDKLFPTSVVVSNRLSPNGRN